MHSNNGVTLAASILEPAPARCPPPSGDRRGRPSLEPWVRTASEPPAPQDGGARWASKKRSRRESFCAAFLQETDHGGGCKREQESTGTGTSCHLRGRHSGPGSWQPGSACPARGPAQPAMGPAGTPAPPAPPGAPRSSWAEGKSEAPGRGWGGGATHHIVGAGVAAGPRASPPPPTGPRWHWHRPSAAGGPRGRGRGGKGRRLGAAGRGSRTSLLNLVLAPAVATMETAVPRRRKPEPARPPRDTVVPGRTGRSRPHPKPQSGSGKAGETQQTGSGGARGMLGDVVPRAGAPGSRSLS